MAPSDGGSEDSSTGDSAGDDTPERMESVDPPLDPGSPILETVLENERNRPTLGQRLAAADGRVETDHLIDVVRHGPVLEALLSGPKDHRELEAELDVSRATSHRFTQWLGEEGLVEKVDGRFQLTGRGEAIVGEVLRFEANVRTADRLAPLLDRICEDHQEFIVEPFLDATVTEASPGAPYAPAERFVTLVSDSDSFRGFNTTHMAPVSLGGFHEEVFEKPEVEIVYLPSVVDSLFERYPERARAAVDRGDLALRTRDDLPYGLALFDDCVGIGGYDDSTGQLEVFVDTDDPVACEWAERVYTSVRADSEPIEGPVGSGG